MSKSFAERQAASAISAQECRAMRALDEDPDYTRREIAFMMECQATTVTQHADGWCGHHQNATQPDIAGDEQAASEFLDSVGGVGDGE